MSDRQLLRRFWIEAPAGLLNWIGVTAYSTQDAIQLLADAKLEVNLASSDIREVRFEELDGNHVVPNMGVISRRGVWYPNLNS
jgi:hypothetical protein